MIGFWVGEDETWFEFKPIFANNEIGFALKMPFHFGCKHIGEYGIAWSRINRIWTMWGNSGYPRNPFYVFWDRIVLHKIVKKIKK